MIDMNMIKSFIHGLFQGSGNQILSKQEILRKVMQSKIAPSVLPFFKQISDKSDYNERSLTESVQGIMQKQGSATGVASKIRSKIGV
jgi:hypothetical protein